ncbi:Dual specificity testis-specific protein kinase 2 [Zootermopsis nevadensis]|uniref:dual-specificity kinase n=2 Tax=Zootermopsis nevadensis TaxID=136037 RepID=A0A067RFJ2_ZOONE|nr:Dual specificity testis-specific protein kinase 2 [Zootermopsis nevadensis]
MGVCVHEGQLHALTEYINGGSLEQLIQNRTLDLPHATRMKLALDIAKGMEYLHSRGVFHRDLTSKNVLIKKNEENGEMMAVVGDFGLAAKIPDPLCGYRLPTVGSPYWMSPECLKGQWYDEKSDVFSYGIVLCELIARVEADPDILPRTENFGLDYLAFSEMCGPCPPDFLKLAFSCCTFQPKSRPSFAEIVTSLDQIICDYQKNKQQDASGSDKRLMSCVSLGSDEKTVKMASCLGAHSEEVIPTSAAEAEALLENRDKSELKKSNHRRSLSEDVGCVVFSPHTAPSDKARCHFVLPRQQSTDTLLLTPKHVGESMVKQDPHYKPMSAGDKSSRTNPFATLSQFRGVKKILGGLNKGVSPNTYTSGAGGDLFSSCFELPSPFYGPTPPSTPTGDPSVSMSAKSDSSSLDEKRPLSPLSSDVNTTVLSSCKLAQQPLSLPASPTLMRRRILTNSSLVPPPPLLTQSLSPQQPSSCEDNQGSEKIPKKSVFNCSEDSACRRSSGSFTSKKCKAVAASSLFTHPLFRNSECNSKTEQIQKGIGTSSTLLQLPQVQLQHPLLLNQRVCSSSLNLADPSLLLSEDHGGSLGFPSSVLKRRGSCESGFFSSVGEDFGCTAGDLLSPSEFPGIHASTRSHHTASTATLSSSSAASSLFLLDDSAVSTTTVSSLRSGSGELGDLDDLATAGATSGVLARSAPHHSLLFAAKRSSSIYTDSSEDISSLGGGDLSYWEDRSFSGIGGQPQQISKIVEYFERKQSCNYGGSNPGLGDGESTPSSVWDLQESQVPSKHQRDMLFHQAAAFGNRNSPMDFARRMEGASLNDAMRSSKIALLRKSLEKVTGTNLSSGSPQQSQLMGPTHTQANAAKGEKCVKRNATATQRLMICEGAVRSKLPLFDKK